MGVDDLERDSAGAASDANPTPASQEKLPTERESSTSPVAPIAAETTIDVVDFDPALPLVESSIPDDVVLEAYPLHPEAARLWAIANALMIGVPTLPILVVAGVWQGPWAMLAVALLAVLVWSIASRHLRVAVARFRCERFARGLRYTRGVWWQSEVFIPTARVQHTEVNQGPIARRYGIGKLKVFTAAVQLGALEIDGLAYTDAVLLRDRLLGRQGDAAVEALAAADVRDAPDA